MRAISTVKSDEWPIKEVDFDEDAVTYMEKAQSKEEKKAEGKQVVPVDPTGVFEKSYKVFV